MEVRALFGRFVWRGVNIDDVTIPILPEVRGSIPHWRCVNTTGSHTLLMTGSGTPFDPPLYATVRDRNVDLPMWSKCKKFALKSCCTISRFNWKFNNFQGTYSNEFYITNRSMFEFYIILLVWCSWLVCCKDRGLHLYMNDMWYPDRIDNSCKGFVFMFHSTVHVMNLISKLHFSSASIWMQPLWYQRMQ